MLAIIVILLLLPLMFLVPFIGHSTWFTGTYLLMATILIVREYFRRMHYAGTIKKFKYVVLINLTCLAFFLGFLLAHL